MIQIYHVPNTRGTRVIWLCEELGIPYTVRMIDFSAAYRATDEWRALNPVGKVPVLTDGDMTMFESGAMMDYILGRYGNNRLRPQPSHPDYPYFLQWHWFAEATIARPLGEIVNHGREFPGNQRIAAVVDEMANRAAVCVEAVADHMQGRNYLAGETFTAADISMGYSLLLAAKLIPERMPEQIQTYWQSLQARRGFQIATGDFAAT